MLTDRAVEIPALGKRRISPPTESVKRRAIEEEEHGVVVVVEERDATKEYVEQASAYRARNIVPGFYIGQWKDRIWVTGGLVLRCSDPKSGCREDELRKAARFGVEAYDEQLRKENKDHVDLRLRKVVRANRCRMVRAKLYYITMLISDGKFYEAEVWECRNVYELYSIRPAVYYPAIEETYSRLDMTTEDD